MIQVGTEPFATFHLRSRERPVRVRTRCRNGLCRNMAQLAVAVFRIERLEALSLQCSVQPTERPWAVTSLVPGVVRIHQPRNDSCEGIWRSIGRRLWFVEDLLKRVSDPNGPR